MSSDLKGSFEEVERIARASKFGRMRHSPAKYLYAILYRRIFARFLGLSTIKKIDTFFNRPMLVRFPAGTDIYLTGGKTDDAELGLTKFLLNELKRGDLFIDVGAHFGFYTLLASLCTGDEGKVIAIEPSVENFALLKQNIKPYPNITAMQVALAEKEAVKTFYAFPHIYSEYSSVYPEQFRQQRWFGRIRPKKTEIKSTTLDHLSTGFGDSPVFVKIDTEGSEYDVLSGGRQFLEKSNAVVIMEYLGADQDNTHHKQAAGLLRHMGYSCYRINQQGGLVDCKDPDDYFTVVKLRSDNLVFKK